ncbi:MetQ/NlpA family ABC transporter substrate-binding protein [Gordonia rubripertincta]|uniref:MetQ/NlpA family ABC transporter substrate-binding protein n=2 Tax=Gordonia rubripertincta TaxID=36822 RepID=A0AAW4G274_GORRU|nr:MetQ/NlpA family ABC transporter substrate-binding protein [Gordonia rubripertincta]MBM7277344.1 metal ABC transporter substrate-binding protein [Gordonia rubripertincta]MDG6780298.1 MetQ/NlpA family ABC transporter substrate-binding protein [Gordonia rubripertincta]NKY63585.1 metal ABC transporter substrate-binding protein [Gordonia rubripertincta]QMU20504.1 metal ABC transporter substrate-binding protein [Gordonia rubripertincta]GAB84325.1 methionine ABC transporter substrate-binding prot
MSQDTGSATGVSGTSSETPPPAGNSDIEISQRRRWPLIAGALVVVAVLAGVLGWRFLGSDEASPNETPGATLTVVTAEGNAAEQALVEFIAEKVAPKYDIKVAFRGLADSTTLNRAVSDGEVAGTIYQHKLWLSQVLEANPDFKEVAATPVFRWGFGIWSDKYKTPQDLPQNAKVSLYSDPANEAQGLWLLERAGLITLKPGIDKWKATQKDIATNPRNLQFVLLDFAAQSRSLADLDATVGYTEYYLAANIPIEKQIYAPPAPDEFAGQLTIGTEWENTDNIKNLVAAFKDPAVQEFLATDPQVKNILLPL